MTPEQARRESLERMNGRVATWVHYNKWTLWLGFLACLTLYAQVYVERTDRVRTQQDLADAKAFAASTSCYAWERSTSLIIVGDSQRAVDRALLDVAQQVHHTQVGRVAAGYPRQ